MAKRRVHDGRSLLGGLYRRWRLEEAKARFSEMVRQARSGEPQVVTVHGQEAVVVVSADQFARLQGAGQPQSLHTFLSTSPLAQLEFDSPAEHAPVRDVQL
ncbi:MAG: type II toxin-antitoxin system Phd/YefM family antitoxin [Aphanocapsa lilacina HA4352-LM1]|jgi:prevent-host-death family protein|nr:type II toxin-antitoxin system Phd/YefM family antitoxin [Aphanocapsa lilacina HA4352-LM1]